MQIVLYNGSETVVVMAVVVVVVVLVMSERMFKESHRWMIVSEGCVVQ